MFNIKHGKIGLFSKNSFVVLFLFSCIVLVLSGCNRYNIKPPINSLNDKTFSLEASQFVFAYEQDKLWGIDKSSSIIDNSSVELSIKEANKKNGYYSNSGGGGAAGLIGTIIGIQIVREASKKSLVKSLSRTSLNKLQSDTDSGSTESILKGVFQAEEKLVVSKDSDHFSEITENYNKNHLILVEPRFYFSSNYKSLRVNLIVEVLNKENQTLFRNLYIFSGEPISGDKNQCAEYWVANKFHKFKRAASQSVSALMMMIRNDLSSTDSSIIPVQHSSVRYQDTMGNHYVRGEVLDKKENRLVIRTLRGYLKSVYVDKYL